MRYCGDIFILVESIDFTNSLHSVHGHSTCCSTFVSLAYQLLIFFRDRLSYNKIVYSVLTNDEHLLTYFHAVIVTIVTLAPKFKASILDDTSSHGHWDMWHIYFTHCVLHKKAVVKSLKQIVFCYQSRTKICGFKSTCPALACRNAPIPVGGCCPVCGKKLRFFCIGCFILCHVKPIAEMQTTISYMMTW